MKQARNFLVRIGLLFTLATVFASAAFAQKPARSYTQRPFEPAEELVYEAEFSRSLLRKVDIADFRFTSSRMSSEKKTEPSDPSAKDKTAHHSLVFTSEISSKGFFSKLFNLRFRERVESTVDPISLSVQKTKRLDEQGKRVRSSEAVFDKAAGKVVWTERDPRNPSGPERRVSSEFSGIVHDILSAIYYLRTQPLQVGTSLELSVSDSGQVYKVPIKVVEKKRLKTILGRVDAVRIDAGLFGPQGMIESDGQFSIWFTEDSRRIPVSARVKNEYGTFDIKLKKATRSPDQQEYLTKQP